MISKKISDSGIKFLQDGRLIVYPTDTLYALGAAVYHHDAVNCVYMLKHRPLSVPLPIAVSSVEKLEHVAVVTPLAKILAQHFLPGSLTLLLEKKDVPSIVTAQKQTVAVRIPDDPIALHILDKTGPLTVTSANIHGQPTPSSIDEIRNMFKSECIALFIDDGVRRGEPSTIVDVRSDQPRIIRPGNISFKQIKEVVLTNHG